MDTAVTETGKRMQQGGSAWSPLKESIFRSLWLASIFSNIGTWVQNTATAWLMTSISPSAVMVSLVQTATSLPVFLLALPAGALADILDRRRLILVTQMWMLVAAALLGVLDTVGIVTPWALLLLTLALGLGSALNAPAWQSIVPELVPKQEVPDAVALNSAGFNLARAVGPALGGLIVGWLGAAAAFYFNAATYVAVVYVLYTWKRTATESTLPTERMIGAIRSGLRYVRHAPAMRAVLTRVTLFMTAGCSIMSLLPVVAKEMGLGATGYGILLASFGFGAVAGAGVLPAIRKRLSPHLLVVSGNISLALSLVLLAWSGDFAVLCGALVLGGAAWLCLISTFNSSIQALVPSWVRGRALAVYMLVLFGGMAGGSVIWGAVAEIADTTSALLMSGAGVLAGMLATYRLRFPKGEPLDFTPSLHWASPMPEPGPGLDEGPVLVTVEYRIDPARETEFRLAARRLKRGRLRSGARRWSLYSDMADPGRFIESFLVETWLEHLRQHERVTVNDRGIEEEVRAFHEGSDPPKVNHFLARPLPRG